MKLILFTSLALVVGMIIGCGSNPSNPARSTAPETAREIAATPARGVTLPGSSKITPTQVQIGLPQILSSSRCADSRNGREVACGGKYRS